MSYPNLSLSTEAEKALPNPIRNLRRSVSARLLCTGTQQHAETTGCPDRSVEPGGEPLFAAFALAAFLPFGAQEPLQSPSVLHRAEARVAVSTPKPQDAASAKPLDAALYDRELHELDRFTNEVLVTDLPELLEAQVHRYYAELEEVPWSGSVPGDDESEELKNSRPRPGKSQNIQASSISQFGITWTFDKAYEAGQFANGDWWVVGPVKITDIQPPSTIDSSGRAINGSMVNPLPTNGTAQGYDSATYGKYVSSSTYQPALNVALGVSASKPLVLPPASSLISTRSVAQAGARPQVGGASILTVLGTKPPKGSFRPPYCGSDKTIRFRKRDLNPKLLAKLPLVPSAPKISQVELWFERPWIDHVPDWPARYIHPVENMPDYGRDIADRIGIGALMLHAKIPILQKAPLAFSYVQLGIDLFGIVENSDGTVWFPAGGHTVGRKWPILFAGLMLNDPDMSAIGGRDEIYFSEDAQTFYVEETSPGVYNYGFGGYSQSHVGLPEWGQRHDPFPQFDDSSWLGDPYRTCCTANSFYGFLLAARVMGVESLWNHQELFDYQDRFLSTGRKLNLQKNQIYWTSFPVDMWDEYRQYF